MEDLMKKNRRKKRIAEYDSKFSEEPKIYWGIPMNPQYMDGKIRRGSKKGVMECDRYGRPMSVKESNALEWWREDKRKQWLKEKDNE